MEKFIKKIGKTFLGVVVLVIIATLVYSYSQKNPSTGESVVKSPQEVLIESKGLAEFSAENNSINAVSSQDKKLAEEMMPIFKEMGDGKDIAKNKKTVVALGEITGKYPEYSDAYLLRATVLILVGDKDYQKTLSDIDNAIKFHSSDKYKSAYDSTAGMYSLRAKVDILSGNNQQAISDLETAIKSDPSKISDVFNTGGVKPEDDSNTTVLQKKDLDLLVAKYPDDYRTYMFRGLFYAFFTTFDEQYYTPALNDLNQALKVNPNSVLVNYFLGTVIQEMAFWTKSAASDISDVTGARGGYKEKTNERALGYFQEAFHLDPKFAEASVQIAEGLFELKRYSEAIPMYDKVIELEPENAGAYNDRGLAKTDTNNYFDAIRDFTKAVELKKSRPNISLGSTHENRAAAYVKVMNYDSAIEDYSRAIGLKFASQVFLMSVSQIRAIYPEFSNISDQDLLEGLRQKYFPNMSSADFVGAYKHDITNNSGEKKPFKDFVLGDLYTSRGDTSLLAGKFRNAAKDYARAITEGSTSVMDRWKIISKTPDSEYSVDIQTLDFSQGNITSLWVKVLNTKTQNYSQQNYQIDCSGRKLKAASATNYNSIGNVIYTRPVQDWQSIVPESIGEFLYNGMCK
jgi:tetratricopeptide (TPR) repeat protein